MNLGRRARGRAESLAVITAAAALLGCGVGTDTADDVTGSTAAALPAGWVGTDIGTFPTGAPGSSDSVLGSNPPATSVFTLTSSATGIALQHNNFNQGDNVRFVSRSYTPPATPTTGDFEVKVRLTSLSGSVNGQAGLMVRQSTSTDAFNVVAYLRKNEVEADAPEIPDVHAFGHVFRERWAPGTPDLDPSANATAATRMDPGPDPDGAQDPPASFYRPIWFRIQRSGSDYAVARSANGVDWVPLHNASGGRYPLTGTVQVGFFVAAANPTGGPTSATAVFDNFSISEGPRAFRTSWVGASYDQASTGFVSQAISSFFVSPDGSRVYKHYPIVEEGAVLRILDGANGRVQPTPQIAHGVEQGALAGDGTSVYFARKELTADKTAYTGRYCIDRLKPDLTPLDSPVSVCAPEITRVGGMAVGRDSGGVPALFVSELGPLPPPGGPPPAGTIRLFRADTLAPAQPASFSVAARPGPMAVDNNFNLWVIHTAVDGEVMGSYDVPFAPAVKRYNASGAVTGQLTGALLPQNPVAIAVDRRAGLDRMFVADNGSAQNIRVYRGLAGTPSADTTYNASATFGQSGGIYTTTSRGMLSNASGNDRLYALAGVAIDSAGALHVALGAPYVDIRKYDAAGTAHATSSAWSTYGLMNFSNLIDFDETTDGQDAYSARHHISMNLASTTPGGEWSLRSMTWDPFPPAPLAYREKDEHGVTRRRSGIPRIKTIDGQKFLFLMGDADPDPDGDTGPRGSRRGLLIYRFNGEIAIPWAAIRQEGICALDDDVKEACGALGNPMNCACNIDPDNVGSLDPYQVMTIWIDSNGDGVENEAEQSTINPLGMTLTGCETSNTCPIFENGAENFEHPSQEMWDNPPPRSDMAFSYFDVDANGDIWLSYGNDGKAFDVHMPGNPERVMSAAIWQLKRTAGAITPGQGPRYSLTLGSGRAQHPVPPEMTRIDAIRFQRTAGEAMYLVGADAAGNPVINHYDNWLTGTRLLRATATLPVPPFNVDVNAGANDFMYLRNPPTKRCGVVPPPADTSGCNLDWKTAVFFQWTAFDVAGDKMFIAEQWGPIHVFDAATGLPVTTIFAGPEESGFHSWNDGKRGLRAFKRSNGEYLIAAMDSSGHSRTFLFRWTPTVLPGCTSDTQCAAGQFCDAGTCQARPCNLSDPFASMASLFPAPQTADGFTLSANRLATFVSNNNDIYTATRLSPTAAFGPLTSIGLPVNSAAEERAPWLSEDGLRLYYSMTTANGSTDLMVASRSAVTSGFTTSPSPVPGANDPTSSDEDPFLMPGEQTLYFQSTRSGGGRDIYVATKSGSTFTNITPVTAVNSTSEDSRPTLTRDGLTMFLGSRRPAPSGDTDGDIWVAQRTTPTGTFTAPTNVVSLNTSGAEFPVSLSADGCTLTFASNRETGLGGTQVYRLYQATRAGSPSTVTVTMNIVGNGTVTTAPFNCGPNTPGICTVQRPFGTTLLVEGNRQAEWSGACQANGTPGLSTDAHVSFTLGGTCTVTFP
jgi:Cys-rich repeat protein